MAKVDIPIRINITGAECPGDNVVLRDIYLQKDGELVLDVSIEKQVKPEKS